MKWTPGEQSKDIEDVRGESGDSGGDDGGGGGGGFNLGGRHIGLGGLAVVVILSLVFHQNFFSMLTDGSDGSSSSSASPSPQSAPSQAPASARGGGAGSNSSGSARARGHDEKFLSFVLDDVQGTWDKLLPAQTDTEYRHAKLRLFRDHTKSGCGRADEESGPFYCPADEKVYLDLAFYDELRTRFGAPGEFAQAYVVAHEIGHHVQALLGLDEKMDQMKHAHKGTANQLSVRFELQADCLAGVWGHTTQERGLLEAGEVKSALDAASAIGDDRLEKEAGERVNPDTFTHGTSAQRVAWFQRGFDSGKVSECDTLANRTP